MLDANPHMIETISLYARVAAFATCSRLDWTLMILVIPLPYILWIMALHTKLCSVHTFSLSSTEKEIYLGQPVG